jgi:hypothetical protein
MLVSLLLVRCDRQCFDQPMPLLPMQGGAIWQNKRTGGKAAEESRTF